MMTTREQHYTYLHVLLLPKFRANKEFFTLYFFWKCSLLLLNSGKVYPLNPPEELKMLNNARKSSSRGFAATPETTEVPVTNKRITEAEISHPSVSSPLSTPFPNSSGE